MIKKIKQYFTFRKILTLEILEALINICKYLDFDGRYSHNPYSQQLRKSSGSLRALREEVLMDLLKNKFKQEVQINGKTE